MSLARQKGINLFDNAETYGNPAGAAEEIMGEAMSQLQKEDQEIWRRSEIIVSTKIFWGGTGVNERGLSRKHINEGLDASLQRLQMDYVDLLFCHRPDPFTPTETIVRAMTDVVRSGGLLRGVQANGQHSRLLKHIGWQLCRDLSLLNLNSLSTTC
ncbi:MAG: hypothetical protein Ct9H300mP28_20110 [Pseudomonadota bacterium]|nr:MAG: hypothetical protein Ct9H300mP28_20110 [Pseudomonadota bacterium]